MTNSCIMKIIMGGSPGSGKTTLLNGAKFPFNNEEYYQIGVSFKLIDCIVNNKDSYLLQIWDLKTSHEFRNLFPSFCKGAKGAILCFDTTDYNSFKELIYWIETIKKMAGEIPIILIGTKIDLNDNIVKEEEVNTLIEDYNLDGIFYSALDKKDQKSIFKQLIRSVRQIKSINSFSMIIPDYDYDFNGFMKKFSSCPICGNKNHYNYLKRFYFSKKNNNVKIRDKLLDLIDKATDIDELFRTSVKFGIPCCRCYEKIFGKN